MMEIKDSKKTYFIDESRLDGFSVQDNVDNWILTINTTSNQYILNFSMYDDVMNVIKELKECKKEYLKG